MAEGTTRSTVEQDQQPEKVGKNTDCVTLPFDNIIDKSTAVSVFFTNFKRLRYYIFSTWRYQSACVTEAPNPLRYPRTAYDVSIYNGRLEAQQHSRGIL